MTWTHESQEWERLVLRILRPDQKAQCPQPVGRERIGLIQSNVPDIDTYDVAVLVARPEAVADAACACWTCCSSA
jgi:hypothetical protein